MSGCVFKRQLFRLRLQSGVHYYWYFSPLQCVESHLSDCLRLFSGIEALTLPFANLQVGRGNLVLSTVSLRSGCQSHSAWVGLRWSNLWSTCLAQWYDLWNIRQISSDLPKIAPSGLFCYLWLRKNVPQLDFPRWSLFQELSFFCS